MRKRTQHFPPGWVRKADWRWRGDLVTFAFPHLAHDEEAEARELAALDDYIEQHQSRFWQWVIRVDLFRGREVVRDAA